MSCPSNEALRIYLHGALGDDASDQLADHVESCETCRKSLEEISGTNSDASWNEVDDRTWADDVSARLVSRLRETLSAEQFVARLELPVDFGDYELLERIGRGGVGTVYRARQKKLNRTVAVKLIGRRELSDNQLERFHVETTAAARLEHAGIVRILDAGQLGPYLFYSMPIMSGGSLSDRLRSNALGPRESVMLVRDTALAVAYAHERGIIHRDLKPANILLDREGQPQVADFGLAKISDLEADFTATGEIIGTPSYMSPEQAKGTNGATTACDIYGLGAILYHLLTGIPPFDGSDAVGVLYQVVNTEPKSIRSLAPRLPLDLDTIVLRCLAKQPSDRFETAGELARELTRYLHGEPIHSRPVGPISRLGKWCVRHPAIAAMTAVTLLALVTGSIASTYFGVAASRAAEDASRQAVLASAQADILMTTLEETVYDTQAGMAEDPAQQETRQRTLNSALQSLGELEAMEATVISRRRILQCRARALHDLAVIAEQIGDGQGATGFSAAQPIYLEAIRTYETLRDLHDKDASAAIGLVAAKTDYGDSLAGTHTWKEARIQFEAALLVASTISDADLQDGARQGRLLDLEILYGESLNHTGEGQEAGTVLKAAVAHGEKLLEDYASCPTVQNAHTYGLMELGDWHDQRNELDEAEKCYRRLNDWATQFFAQRPQSYAQLMERSTAWERLGVLSRKRGDYQMALEYYQRSLQLALDCVAYAPNHDGLQGDLSYSYQGVAQCLLDLKQEEAAREQARLCADIRRKLAAKDILHQRLQGKLIHALQLVATSSERLGDQPAAAKTYKEIIQVADRFRVATRRDVFRTQRLQAEQKLATLAANVQNSG